MLARTMKHDVLWRTSGVAPALAVALGVAVAACGEGSAGGPSGGGPASSIEANVPGDDGTLEGSAGEGDGAGAGAVPLVAFPAAPPAEVASETRLTRLTHAQYQRTIQDLFGIDGSLDLTFAPDAVSGFGFDTSNALRVDARLGPQYRTLAERLAGRVLGDADLFARVVPCEPALADCAQTYLASFGERAFRRPLAPDELQAFAELFAAAGDIVQSGDAFTDGVRLTLEAFLQSPQFLYRTEQSIEVDAEGRVQLDDWEVASRLSYVLYDSMPDAELFELARSGQLSTTAQIASALRGMLRAPRALSKLVDFHEQAWDFGRFSSISPDRATYPDAPVNFVARARRAAELFVREVLASGGGLKELLTAPYAFVDDGLAPLYGLPQSGDDGVRRVEFDAGERRGLLMQVGFLAANAYSIKTDPIHRGLFVIRNVLCREVPPPPPGASMTPLPDTAEPLDTTRQEISVLTGQSYCPSCHTQINPPGFAFEGFDAVGQARELENGVPVDTSAQMVLDGQLVSFSGPLELIELLARSEEAQRCYTRRLMEYTFGRPLAEQDVPLLDTLGAQSLPMADLVEALLTSELFSKLGPSASGPPDTSAAGSDEGVP